VRPKFRPVGTSAQVKYLVEMTACLRKEESDTCVSSSCSFSCLEKSTILFLPYRRAGIIFLEAEFNFPDNISISYLSLLAFAWALLSLSCRFLQVFARFSEKFASFPHHHLYCTICTITQLFRFLPQGLIKREFLISTNSLQRKTKNEINSYRAPT
jgi:hypothetical protein